VTAEVPTGFVVDQVSGTVQLAAFKAITQDEVAGVRVPVMSRKVAVQTLSPFIYT
jgi:hypothetical protein